MPSSNRARTSKKDPEYRAIIQDWDAIQAMSQSEHRICLNTDELTALLGIAEYLRWSTRWKNLSISRELLTDWTDSLIAKLLGDCPVDCAEIESCLNESDIINIINNTLIDHTTVIEDNSTQISTIEQQITVIESTCECNQYPPPPTINEPDLLCSSAVYIVQKLSDFWHDVVTDAQTITFDEFIESLFDFSGGWVGGAIKLLWDYVVSNSNPNLVAEGEAGFDEVVALIYCNELDRDLTDLDIDASTTLTADAKALWRGALSSFSDGKLAQWAYIGSLKDLTNEACACGDSLFWSWDTAPGGWTPPAGWGFTPSHGIITTPGQFRGYGTYIGGSASQTAVVTLQFTMPSTFIDNFHVTPRRNGTATTVNTCRVQAGSFDETQAFNSNYVDKVFAINEAVTSLTVTMTVTQTFCGCVARAFEFEMT